MSDRFVIEVSWDETAHPTPPSLIGPFDTEREAADFLRLNVPNGVAIVRTLAYPYAVAPEGKP